MVRFLTRPGCHLCEDAYPLVFREAQKAGVTLEVFDIETDDTVLSEFGMRIPVVLGPDGEVLAEGQIERRALRRALRRTGARGWLRRPSPR